MKIRLAQFSRNVPGEEFMAQLGRAWGNEFPEIPQRENWENDPLGWHEVPLEFHALLLGITLAHLEPYEREAYPHSFVVKQCGNMLIVRWVDQQGPSWHFGAKEHETGIFHVVPPRKECHPQADGSIVLRFEDNFAVFGEDHPAWPHVLHAPERYVGLARLKKILKPSKDNPLTGLLESDHVLERYAAEGLKKELKTAMKEIVAALVM
jgi:hypothetical protein